MRIAWAAAMLVVAACASERALPDAGGVVGRIHPPGISDPDSPSFHGHELARRGWDLHLCAGCHGEDFAGGAAGVSCTACHTGGPGTCETCHTGTLDTGAHRIHVVGGAGCPECHVTPGHWDDDGHLRRGSERDPPPAELTFGALAAKPTAARDGPPMYDAGTCTNVYCHGDASTFVGAVNPEPSWHAEPVLACDRCHGFPPPGHVEIRCAACHPPELHVDGAVQLGRTAGCDGCHGRAGDPAPPLDLWGSEARASIGVGAHQAHGAAGVPCTACHALPASILSPGHIDTPYPAEVHATLGWSRATATCASAGCHGPLVWTRE